MLLGRTVHFEEEVPELAGPANGEARVWRDTNGSTGAAGDSGLDPYLLTLLPPHELNAWRLP